MNKKTWTDRLGDFIAGKGFYIVLFLCVAAIGISGYYLFSSLGPDGKEVAAGAPAQVTVTPSPSAKPVPTPTRPTVTPAPSATPALPVTPQPTQSVMPSPAVTPSVKPSPLKPTASVFTWPVKGEIIHDYSLEVLAYDETMGDWRTHCGLDIGTALGVEVCAAAAGTVESVYKDDLMGTTVVIDHGNQVKSIYSNLAAVPTVSVGDAVNTGTVIGSVGATAIAEASRLPHLHFEMSRGGYVVDPLQYLP